MSVFLARWRRLVVMVGIVVAALAIGFILRGWLATPKAAEHPSTVAPQAAEAEVQWWTCAMHPQIHQPKPGRCPFCGMELIPVEKQTGEPFSLRQLTVSEAARKLMEIQTAAVERKFVTAETRMVGLIDYDETRLGYITAWVPGRLDRLYVDYTGVSVRKGDHMVYLYSPELLSAQEELLQALRATQEIQKSTLGIMREITRATVEAAREKLRLWGLTSGQIAEVEERGKPTDHLTIYAPMGGVVIHKNALEGMYVQTGTRIYTIADLSQVWAKLDAYESDLMWLRYGQVVEFTTESYPGEVFKGRIAFIDPFLDRKTRTVKIRVDVPNPTGKLKPGMFIHSAVRASVAAGGRVMDPDLANKWICPMHPSVVEEKPGDCRICGMPLVTTESLGYVPISEKDAVKPLVIPASAPLITGTRAVVYLELPNQERPTYEGKEIVLGPRAGDYYIVRHGLKEGERVVTRGNFKIDSALQIEGKPSMMTPEGGGGGGMHHHGGTEPTPSGATAEGLKPMEMMIPDMLRTQVGDLEKKRLAIEEAVESGDIETVRSSVRAFGEALGYIDASALAGHARLLWNEMHMRLKNDSVVGERVADLVQARDNLQELGRHLDRLRNQFGPMQMEHSEHKAEPAETTAHMGPMEIGEPQEQPEQHEGGTPPGASSPEAFREQLGRVYDAYQGIHAALAADDDKAAANAATKFRRTLDAVDMALLAGDAHMAWMRQVGALQEAAKQLEKAKDIQKRREAFAAISEALVVPIKMFGVEAPVFRLHCPMALGGRGSDWLQKERKTRNPYFGKQMLQCGDVVDVISGEKKDAAGEHRHD